MGPSKVTSRVSLGQSQSWWGDAELMLSWIWADDERIMSWWWVGDERVMSGWGASDERMSDDELIMNWWAEDNQIIDTDLWSVIVLLGYVEFYTQTFGIRYHHRYVYQGFCQYRGKGWDGSSILNTSLSHNHYDQISSPAYLPIRNNRSHIYWWAEDQRVIVLTIGQSLSFLVFDTLNVYTNSWNQISSQIGLPINFLSIQGKCRQF